MHYNICITLKIKQEDGAALIGRHARAELWTRFVNGAVKPMDAEIICNLTRGVRQQERVEEIQGKCCVLLDTGKSWEYIGGMVQLMANKQQVAMSQGLLDFGADFQADLERAAEWVARSIRAIDETIRVLKDGLKQSGRKRDEAQRIGVNTEVEVDAAETLRDLQVLRKQYEMIGNYPELVQKAEYWDGESEVDPVGDYLEHARRERLEAEAEGEMSADEYLEAQARREAQEAVPGLFGDGMSMEMRAVESPEKLGEAQAQRKRDLTLENEHVEQGEAWEHLEALAGRPLRNKRSGFVAVVNKPQRKELTNINKAKMSAGNGFSVDAHYAAVSRIEKLFENAVYCGEYPDLKHGEATVHIHRFACPMMIGGEKAVAWLTAKQTTNVEGSERLYNLELVDIEKLAVTLEYLASHRLDTALRPASTDILAQIDDAFKTYFEDTEGNTFSASMETVREMGLLSDGHLVADNAVVVEPGVSFSIEALHASPHKFREFSTDKMGTGEGHQAFGWGLYFSGGRESNEHYYRQFASYRMRYGVDGAVEEKEIAGYVAVYNVIGDVMMKHGGDEMYLRETNRIMAMLHDGWRIEDLQKKDAKWWMEKQPRAYKAAYKAALKELAERGVMVERVDKPSINYRVDLNVDESELLDWDGAVSDELYAEAERVSPDSFGTVSRKNVKGRTVYAALQYELGTAKAASEWLAARGYKGIKYLDGGSRDVGVGTHNYVIFSGRDVKITGINASGDYGAAWEEMEPVESPVTFSMRTKAEPKVKGIGYKVFYRGKDGKLYPPMVANPGGADTPVGVWLDADEGVRAGVSKTGRQQVKAGGKGTQGGSGTLAYRPGWHLGKIPYAIQFNRKNPVTGERDLFPADFVWAEVEYAADVDYQEEAMGYGVNKNGKFQHALAGLPRVPEDGYYEYRTNPNPKTEPWIITGAMKVVRVLTREQVDELVRAAGREPQMVEGDEPGAPVTFSMETVAEMAEIKAEAEKAGTFMKAPNGKRSQLTEMQWLQVRTGAFKRWFGDWENDAENASKVVDENGEPMVVYHGTCSAFTVFDRGKSGESNQYASVGFWFSPIKGFGERFARNSWWGDGEEREMSLFLNVRNPKVFETRADEDYGDAYERFRTDVVALLGKDAEFANIGGRGKAWHKGVNKMGIPDYMSTAEQEAVIDEYREKLKAEGYDGIVIKQTEYDYSTAGSANDQYVVLESAQAKSATDNRGTFDGGNADITYSLSGPSILDAAPTGRMAGEEKMQRLLNYARKEAARWGRTFSKETPNAKAAEAMGTVSSLLASIHKELPPMYRPRVESHLRYVEVYARLIESGKIRTYGKLSKEQRAEVEAELMEVLREEQQRVDAEYEQAKAEALQAAALTGEMAALEEAEKMDVEDEVQRAAYLERVAKRAEAEARKRLLAEAEAKKKQLDAEVEALKREFGAEKLGAIAKRMLTDAANSVERYLIDEELATVPKLLERLAPKKLPNGKYDKGKMSADGYRKLVRYVEMIDSTAEEVAERMEALGLQIAAEEAKSDAEGNADKLDALQAELAEWSTYGNLRGKQLEAVRAGVRALADFAAYEKNAWQGMLQLKRARIKRQALKAAEALGGADEHKVKQVVEKEEGLLHKAGNLLGSFQSLSQMFYALGGVPELRALADESLDALSAGHVALTMREKRAYEQLAEFLKSIGIDTENKRNDFMAALKKVHDTGVSKAGELVRHKLKLDPKDAAMWVSMTKEERDAKRAEMEAEAEKHGVLVENVPYEEDIALLEAELKRYNEKPEGRKWIQTEREFRREGPAETMKLSKDEALNILLLCEQDDYVDAAGENGYTAEVLDQLREFVGSDVLSFGYALRDVLENNGLAEVYEAREGVPFPKVANYWPGNFDQSARANEQAKALDPTSGNGTRYGMLITRVKHKLKFNILGASNVFMAALAQQNNYIVVGELTAKWRGLMSHSDFAMALKAHMGEARFKTLKELINLLDGAGVQESVTQQSLSGLTAIFQRAHAMAVLAGSLVTLVKQVSAMFNAGAWQGISMWRVAARLILDRIGKGAIRYDEMLKKDYFQARYKDNRYFTEMLQLGRNANWSRLSKYARGAMNLIEGTDVATNCFAMTALYNITYHDLKHRNKDAVDPLTEAEMHAECDRVVRNTLDLGSQPLRRTQKSAFAALSRTSFVRTISYMGSESINKIGMTLATMKREGGGGKGFWKAWKYVAGMSFAQQLIIMALDMARGADPIDDDEWAKWALLNLATGATGLGILQTVPVLGEALQWGSGGYLKTGSMGEMVYDFGGLAREMKKGWDLVVFNSEDSVEIKKSRKSPYWQVTYKKQDGSRVTTSTDVPVEGGEFEGVELSKEEAEAKALEVGKRIAEEDSPSWADWGMMGANLLRYGAAFTGAWKGINSTSKAMSELSGMLQSLNAMVNTVRPFIQRQRNNEREEKKFEKKMEKEFREARKKTNERLKKQREEAKKKKEAEKKRKERLKRL